MTAWTAEYEPLPGTIGLVPIAGQVGKLIRLGQWLAENPIARWFRRNTEPNLQHAFVYLGDGQIIEAEPGGARIAPVTEYSGIYWCEGIASRYSVAQLQKVATSALKYKGVPYSFTDYLYLLVHRLHLWFPGLKHLIQRSGHVICSQLVADAYTEAGIHLFRDGRWSGDVMPMDLYVLDRSL